jgi:hypothetical protein
VTEIKTIQLPSTDFRLGRHVEHDPRSRAYAVTTRRVTTVKSFRHKVFDPTPTPNQRIGCCTGVDQCVRADARGNRVRGEILGMDVAVSIYRRATVLDAFPGSYPPNDTGSSGLAAAKAAKEAGIIDRVTYGWRRWWPPVVSHRMVSAIRRVRGILLVGSRLRLWWHVPHSEAASRRFARG